ncbi:tetratricopeptide repeat protein [Almyronema epifaneia]|uniref:Tetratricopeptide repeat protein n=1 Tax=Almyronema epifaneia S1 TaxID=2991925 RepID=A0ABW6IHE1_9CYAN
MSQALATPQTCLMEQAHWQAAYYWLTTYQPANDTSLERVKGLLEVFYHLSQLQEWQLCAHILWLPIEGHFTQPLHRQIGWWGHYAQQQDLYQTLLNKLDDSLNAFLLYGLGEVHRVAGNCAEAIAAYTQQLQLAQKLQNPHAEMRALGALSRLRSYYQVNLDLSQQYCQQHLKLARDLGDRLQEARALSGLGIVYDAKRQVSKATAHHLKAWKIVQTTDRLDEKLNILMELEGSYLNRGQFYSLDSLQQRLELTQQLQLAEKIAAAAHSVGYAYTNQQKWSQAIAHFELALAHSSSIGNRRDTCLATSALGAVYARWGRWKPAIAYTQQALLGFQRLEDHIAECQSWFNLCYCYSYTQELDKALHCAVQIRRLARATKARHLQGYLLLVMGHIYWQRRQRIKAIRLAFYGVFKIGLWHNSEGKISLRRVFYEIWHSLVVKLYSFFT